MPRGHSWSLLGRECQDVSVGSVPRGPPGSAGWGDPVPGTDLAERRVCRRGHSRCCSTCGPRDTPHRSCRGPGTSLPPWGRGMLPLCLRGKHPVGGIPWWGTPEWPRMALGDPAGSHLRGCLCRCGRSQCWCTSVPGDTASRPRTPLRTDHHPCPSSLQGHSHPLSRSHPRGLMASSPWQKCSCYLWAWPHTPRCSRCCSTSPLACRRCHPGTGSGACAAGPSMALPAGTARGALRRQGPAQGAGPTHTVPHAGSGLPALTSGWAGTAHGTAGEAALLLPGTVPVMGAGILLLTQLWRLLWPHPRALTRFV